jgi:hypothetical protein
MRWEDERWVKVYTRDTAEWLALGWEAQALFLLLLRKSDRAGLLHSGRARVRGLAALAGMPLEVVERALPLLLEDGCVQETDKGFLIPNFIAAQRSSRGHARRSFAYRQMRTVYFMQERGNASAPIKIGITGDVERRKAEIERAECCSLEVLATLHGTLREEQLLHIQFAEHRVRGEWFQPAPVLLSYVAALNGVKR